LGHRKVSAPKRGSLAFLPRKRAGRWRARLRFWPLAIEEVKPLAFVGYKAGMTHVIAIDNRQGSITFGREISLPVTVVETPPMIVCAIRAYAQTEFGLRSVSEAWMENPPKDLARLLTLPEKFETQIALSKIESMLDKLSELRLVATTQPRLTAIGRKKPSLIEIKLGGEVKDQFDYCKNILGKEIKITDAFKEGQHVDVLAITKGKGIQGPVKRWGIRRKPHKSRKTVREVGSIGPWHPHYVQYSVPRAGQTGFHQRTEYNKQILKIGTTGEVSPKGGFIRYGIVRGPYVLLVGSVPGPPKRELTLRAATRPPSTLSALKIESISLDSKQGS
jgi:large subunit ribosomal protein L3